MKFKLSFLLIMFFSCGIAFSQGVFVYDQQSSTNEILPDAFNGGSIIQSTAPTGQSFVPSIAGVSFVRFGLYDVVSGNNLGANVYVNLRGTSITGPVLGSTSPVALLEGSVGFFNFFFPTAVSVTPGITYFLEPVVQSGDSVGIGNVAGTNGYASGTLFAYGSPNPNLDLWFREGIVVVPEPSSILLVTLGCSAFLFPVLRRRFRRL